MQGDLQSVGGSQAGQGPGRFSALVASFAMVVAQVAPLPIPGIAVIGQAPAAAQSQDFAGTITCRSLNNATQRCSVSTGGRVELVEQLSSSSCIQGRSWTYDRNSITVRNGCQARFGYGYGSFGGSGGSWNNSGQGFAGEIQCRSLNNRYQRCNVDTRNRVELLNQISGTNCVQGRNWGFDARGIWVNNGCQANFGYGYGSFGGSGGSWGGNNGAQGFAGQLECRSENNRYQRCAANTRGRVELLRQFSSTNCVQGRNWGWDNSSIWVDNGCQARFGYGFGNVSGNYDNDNNGGGSAAGIIAGAAVAAGLIALLASSGKKRSSTASGDAAISADYARFPADARAEAEACMKEAARQVGTTGGTKVQLDQVRNAQRSGSGWILVAGVTGTYPDHVQAMVMDCRASGGKVTAFDVR